MGFRKRIAVALTAASLMATVAVGCGGGSSSTNDTTSTANSSSSSAPTTASKGAEPESSALEPSREFLGSGPNGKLAKIGKEASDAEREEASLALEKSLDARAAGDWQTQCSTLASATVEQIEQSASVLGAGPGCAKALEAQAAPAPPAARASTMTGPIDAFRINQGINGFAFYHGTGGKDFVIPMIKQRGEWKVVTLQEEEAP